MRTTIGISALLALSALQAQAAIDKNLLPLAKGTAIVTCSSGLDLDGYVVGLINVRNKSAGMNPGTGKNWGPDMYHGETAPGGAWTAKRMGYVFGIATDRRGNIFLSATSSYGNANGQPYPDQYGPAGSGGIYKIDGFTGEVYDFVLTGPLPNKLPNSGTGQNNPGLGNLTYDYNHDQLLVTNFEDGKIYRIGNLAATGNATVTAPVGTVLGSYDPFAADDNTAGFAPRGERLWGIGYKGGKTYFSRWVEDLANSSSIGANEIWSVNLSGAGVPMPGTLTLRLSAPSLTGTTSNPIADIEFSSKGEMLIAERGMNTDTNPAAHRARVLKAVDSGTINAPVWNWDLAFAAEIGFISNKTNAAGGVDFAYVDESRQGNLLDCEKLFWATGDFLFNDGGVIYGMQGSLLASPKVAGSYFVDFDGVLGTQDKNEQGDVDIWRGPCGEEGCISFNDVQIECLDKAAGTYQVTVNYHYENANSQQSPGANIAVLVDNAVKIVTLNPTVGIGDSGTFTFPLTGLPGQSKIVTVQLHGETTALPAPFDYAFCCNPQDIEIVLPNCRCFEAILLRTSAGLRLQIKNNEITAGATLLQLDLKAPNGTVLSQTTLTMPATAAGATWLSPPLTFTPALAPTATPTLFLTLLGKKRANGVHEQCCSEEFTLRQSGIVVDNGGLVGHVFADLDFDAIFGPRDTPLGNVPVIVTLRSGRTMRAITNAAGEYSLSGIEAGELVQIKLGALPRPTVETTYTVLDADGVLTQTRRDGPVALAHQVRQIHAALPSLPSPGSPIVIPNAIAQIETYAYPSKSIEFRLAEPGYGELTLTGEDGQPIQTLARHQFIEGDNVANFDPSTLAPGSYALRLRFKGTEFTLPFTVEEDARERWQHSLDLREGRIRVRPDGPAIDVLQQ